jgi:hypothetical protein
LINNSGAQSFFFFLELFKGFDRSHLEMILFWAYVILISIDYIKNSLFWTDFDLRNVFVLFFPFLNNLSECPNLFSQMILALRTTLA